MMKINEVLGDEGTFVPAPAPDKSLVVFCDLDGVLVDFDKMAVKVAGVDPIETQANPKLRNQFWKLITRYVKDGNKFFEAMDPTADASELWNYIVKYHPTILSATGHVPNAGVEKRNWVRKHLGNETANRAIFVRTAVDKAQYAAPNHILIDDRTKAINPWVAAGGIGILHKSAANTIAQLKEMGL